jgi:hypothetical protein
MQFLRRTKSDMRISTTLTNEDIFLHNKNGLDLTPLRESIMTIPSTSKPYTKKNWDDGNQSNSYHMIGLTPTKSSLLTKKA